MLLKELIPAPVDLPALAVLTRTAARARSPLGQLNETSITRLDALFELRAGPVAEAPRAARNGKLPESHPGLRTLADGPPPIQEVASVPKHAQLVIQARALDVHEMRAKPLDLDFRERIVCIESRESTASHKQGAVTAQSPSSSAAATASSNCLRVVAGWNWIIMPAHATHEQSGRGLPPRSMAVLVLLQAICVTVVSVQMSRNE